MEALKLSLGSSPYLPTLAASSPTSTVSFASMSPFSVATPSPSFNFNWNSGSPVSLGVTDICDLKMKNLHISTEPFAGFAAALAANNSIVNSLKLPELSPIQASLLPPPGSAGRYPRGSPKNPVLPPVLPQFPNCLANTNMAPHSSANTSLQVDQTVAEVGNARYSVNGKRIGRPPGTRKTVTEVKQPPVVDEVGTDDEGDEVACGWKDCDEKFTCKRVFYEHVEKDHVLKTARKCHECEWENCDHQTFPALYQLNTHVRKHTKERPHKCPWEGCTKRYSRSENLKTHIRTHTGVKPYSCKFPDCEKTFTNASDCSKHQNRVHSKDKPYGCLYPGCPKRYTDPSSLRKHIKVNHLDYNEMTKNIPKPLVDRKYKPKIKAQEHKEQVLYQQEQANAAHLRNPFHSISLLPPQNLPSLPYPMTPAFPRLPILNPLGISQFPLINQPPFFRAPLNPMPVQPMQTNFGFAPLPNPMLFNALKSVLGGPMPAMFAPPMQTPVFEPISVASEMENIENAENAENEMEIDVESI